MSQTGIDQLAAKIDALDAKVDTKFGALDVKFDALEGKFGALDGKFDALTVRVEGLDKALQTEHAHTAGAFSDLKAYSEFLTDRVRNEMRSGFARVDRGFIQIERRFDRLEERLFPKKHSKERVRRP